MGSSRPPQPAIAAGSLSSVSPQPRSRSFAVSPPSRMATWSVTRSSQQLPCGTELDGDHRDRDADRPPRDRHRIADPALRHDVHVVAVLDEGLLRGAERDSLRSADAKVVRDHLRRPRRVARNVPPLEERGIRPGAIHASRRRVEQPAHDHGVMNDALIAQALALLSLFALEMRRQRIQPTLPCEASRQDPLLHLAKPPPVEATPPDAAPFLPCHQARRRQDLQVLVHRRQRHRQPLREVGDARAAAREAFDDRPARRVRQGAEGAVERGGLIVKHRLKCSARGASESSAPAAGRSPGPAPCIGLRLGASPPPGQDKKGAADDRCSRLHRAPRPAGLRSGTGRLVASRFDPDGHRPRQRPDRPPPQDGPRPRQRRGVCPHARRPDAGDRRTGRDLVDGVDVRGGDGVPLPARRRDAALAEPRSPAAAALRRRARHVLSGLALVLALLLVV